MLLMQDFCKDEQANRLLKEHINNRLILMMSEDLEVFGYSSGNLDADSKAFSDYAGMYFPYRYPRNKTGRLFVELYEMLIDDEEHRPKLIQDYVLMSMVRAESERKRLTHTDTVEHLQKNRGMVLSALKKEKKGSAEHVLNEVEDFACYEDLLYEEMDFSLIESFKTFSKEKTA